MLSVLTVSLLLWHFSNFFLSFFRRNDFISVVRSAARTALELMGTESAKQVLNVTKILEDEIKALEGEHAIV